MSKFKKAKINRETILLGILLAFSLFLRLYRIDYPKAYVFDEVYHGFTAVEYTKGNNAAWDWLSTAPKGVAYEWSHPPLAKEIMALSLLSFHTSEYWGWRVPGAILGVVSVYLVFLLGKKIFNNQTAGLFSAFVFSFDGINFVQSRTGMNDIYLVTFILASLYFFLNKKIFASTIFLGLALASKWTAIYFLPLILLIFILREKRDILKVKNLLRVSLTFIVPLLIYLICYIPFFLSGHTLEQFVELHRQMWYYHTHLRASHSYASPWWSWPLNLYPVWFYVEYVKNTTANIFTSGNPIVSWGGFLSIIFYIASLVKNKQIKMTYLAVSLLLLICLLATLDFHPDLNALLNGSNPQLIGKNIQAIGISRLITLTFLFWGIVSLLISFLCTYKKKVNLLIPVIGFFFFWLPWSLSPRIMFLYHYSPSVPFLSLMLGFVIAGIYKSNKELSYFLLTLIFLGFLIVFPFLTGIPLPSNLVQIFFMTNLTKNPF